MRGAGAKLRGDVRNVRRRAVDLALVRADREADASPRISQGGEGRAHLFGRAHQACIVGVRDDGDVWVLVSDAAEGRLQGKSE